MPRKTERADVGDPGAAGASMRPRPDAAENAWEFVQAGADFNRFNEAAARCRGKHTMTAVDGKRVITLQ